MPSPPTTDLPWSGLSTGVELRALLYAITGHPRRPPRLQELFERIGDPFDPDLAAPMTGYARVTHRGLGSAVVASPLFVAYARQ